MLEIAQLNPIIDMEDMRFYMNFITMAKLKDDPDSVGYFEELNRLSFKGVEIILDDAYPNNHIYLSHVKNGMSV